MRVLRATCVTTIMTLPLGLASAAEKPDLRSTDPAMRARAARRIATTGVYSQGDIDLLVAYLGDRTRVIPSDVTVLVSPAYGRDRRETSPGEQAEKALVRIGKPAVPNLLAALKERRYGEPDSRVTFKAARILGEMKERSALPRLKQLAGGGEYGHPNESGADDEFPLAIAKIAKATEYEFLHGLLERAEREKRVNSGLLEAVGYSEDERAVLLLYQYLKNGDRYRKMEVIRALGHTRSPKAIDVLLPFVKSDDPHLRQYSREALTELGRPDLVPKQGQ